MLPSFAEGLWINRPRKNFFKKINHTFWVVKDSVSGYKSFPVLLFISCFLSPPPPIQTLLGFHFFFCLNLLTVFQWSFQTFTISSIYVISKKKKNWIEINGGFYLIILILSVTICTESLTMTYIMHDAKIIISLLIWLSCCHPSSFENFCASKIKFLKFGTFCKKFLNLC